MNLKEAILFVTVFISPLVFIAYSSYDYNTTNTAHWEDCIAKFRTGTVHGCSNIAPKYTTYED